MLTQNVSQRQARVLGSDEQGSEPARRSMGMSADVTRDTASLARVLPASDRPFVRWTTNSVLIMEPAELAAVSVGELSVRKGELLALPANDQEAERHRRWIRPTTFPSSTQPSDTLQHREDERWLPQWV